MHLTPSVNTCSMTELCKIFAETNSQFKKNLKTLIRGAENSHDRFIVANMHDGIQERYGAILKANGFQYIGRYYGNSGCYVNVWAHGLELPAAPAPKKVVRKLVAGARRVRKAISR